MTTYATTLRALTADLAREAHAILAPGMRTRPESAHELARIVRALNALNEYGWSEDEIQHLLSRARAV